MPICVQFHFTLCIHALHPGRMLSAPRREQDWPESRHAASGTIRGPKLRLQRCFLFRFGLLDSIFPLLLRKFNVTGQVSWCCMKHLIRKSLRFENIHGKHWETCILHQTKEIQGQPSDLFKCHAACLDPLPAPVAWRHCSGVWHHVLSCRVGMPSQSFMIFRHLRKARHDKAYKTFFCSMCSGKIGRDHPVQARLNCTVWGTSWLYAPIKHLSDELASHLPLVSSSTCAQSLGNKGGTWSIDSAAIKRQQ